MAGHSHAKNIMHRKGAQDAKKAKLFNKLAREITVAVQAGGPEPATNPRLRGVMAEARGNNMPRERIQRAIQVATGGSDLSNYEDMRYEGYGPGGIALIVEALTDNRNRTAANLRTAFNRYGGNLGETNSVTFLFNRQARVVYPLAVASAEAMFEAALEAGAENVETNAESHVISAPIEDLTRLRDQLQARFGDPQSSGLVWQPLTTISPGGQDQTEALLKLIDALEDDDDVQRVHSNAEFDESVLEALSA